MRRVRFFLRFLVMGWVGAWFMLAYAIGRIGTLFIRGRDRRRSAVAHLRGRTLRRAMTVLGATFVKLGQVMSTRPDLFEPEMIGELRQLQDRLPPFPGETARRTVEEMLGGTIEAASPNSTPRPVAAASVAQVHRARLAGGEEVAVKVLRPDVRAQRPARHCDPADAGQGHRPPPALAAVGSGRAPVALRRGDPGADRPPAGGRALRPVPRALRRIPGRAFPRRLSRALRRAGHDHGVSPRHQARRPGAGRPPRPGGATAARGAQDVLRGRLRPRRPPPRQPAAHRRGRTWPSSTSGWPSTSPRRSTWPSSTSPSVW